MGAIAIITARGGSKRIPRKNIRPFMGKPMLAYALAAAEASDLFEEIMVSTDDDEIARIAQANGAAVPFLRSAKTSDDHATTFDVLEEVLSRYAEGGRRFDTVCCLYPCVPFLSAKTLQAAFRALTPDRNAVIPVCRYPVPIEWALRIENGNLVPNDPQALGVRSQDLVPKYHDAGMFYFIRTAALLTQRTLAPCGTGAFLVADSECQDIDTPEDWASAEMKYRILKGQLS